MANRSCTTSGDTVVELALENQGADAMIARVVGGSRRDFVTGDVRRSFLFLQMNVRRGCEGLRFESACRRGAGGRAPI